MPSSSLTPPSFRPLVIGALYSGSERGLASDVLASRALGGSAFTVCTSLVSAGRGHVTDVLEVPSDSVRAQTEHILETCSPSSARLSILGSQSTTGIVFKTLSDFTGPICLDVTLSGPSGEDVVGPGGLKSIQEGFDQVDVVTMRRVDAERVAKQEISTLSEAQVAVQRINMQGAKRVLLRCGSLPNANDNKSANSSSHDTRNMNVDLYYDGEEFALFEAPALSVDAVRGSSSVFVMTALYYRTHENKAWPEALQQAKAFTTESLHSSFLNEKETLDHFWQYNKESASL